jgi:cytidine deaminase
MNEVYGPTQTALVNYQRRLETFLRGFAERVSKTSIFYEELIKKSLEAQKRALTFATAVGAAVQTNDGKIWLGANVETRVRSLDDHAEKRAAFAALEQGYPQTQLQAIALVYGSEISRQTGEYAYPLCGLCRQCLWDNTHPDLEVIVIDPDGFVIFSGPLHILYPLPYLAKVPERLRIELKKPSKGR